MDQKGKVDVPIILRLSGATIASIGFYFTALNKPIVGASLIGIGGVLLAVGGAI